MSLDRTFAKDWVISLMTPYVSDVDFTSVYPNVMKGANISRDTFASAVYSIGPVKNDDVDIPGLFSRIINTRENTVDVCKQFLGLPDYVEFGKILDSKIGEEELECAA